MEIVLLWCFVLAWMAKRGAEDLVHAVKGTPNPRYELKQAKAKAAGQKPPQQYRYGGKEWFADLYSDALAAHTEKRRTAAKAKAQPVDDMVDVVREPKPTPAPVVRHETPEPPVPPQPKPEPAPDNRPIAPVHYLFPNPQQIEKEITMANSEVTGLSTAIAYARDVASAHQSFSSAGGEGYVGSLEQGGNGPEVISSAREAMEASAIATAKWTAHQGVLEKQLNVREAYQGNPDAGNKQFVVNE